jgi:hypothetical protein
MIETLAIITVTEETQDYGPNTRRFKLEFVSDPEPQSSGRTEPVVRLEALAGSAYAYRESISLKAIAELYDGVPHQAEHSELLDATVTEMRTRIKTYIDGDIDEMNTEMRPHHSDLVREL